MPIDFPDNPANGDVFTSGGRRWEFDGSRWSVVSADAAIGTGSIDASKLAADAVTEAKIASSAVTAGKIGAAAVTEAKLGTGAVTADKIGSSAVTESKIASSAVSHSKLASNLSAITVCTAGTKPASPFDGQVIYMTDVDQTAAWDGSAWVGIERTQNRNMVINGGFDIWQRGTSFANASASPYYTADRWQTYRSAGVAGMTVTRQTSALDGFAYALRAQRDSGNTSTNTNIVTTTFETANVRRFHNKILTLSFYARCGANYSSASSGLGVAIVTGTGSDGNIANGLTSQTDIALSTVTLTTTFQKFTLTMSSALPVARTQLGVRFMSDPIGTAGANDWFEVTGVQLEAGAVATPFEFEDYGTTLAKCQRYYQTVRSLYNNMLGMYSDGTNKFHGQQIAFPTTMRIAPTMAFVTTIAGGFSWVIPNINIYSASNTNNITFTTSASHWAIQQTRTAGGGTPARGDVFTLESDSTFSADAEL